MLNTAEIERELRAGERVLWQGQPRQGIRLRVWDAFAIPFTVLWAGFAFFWEFTVLKSGAPIFFAAFGIPFMIIGIYIVLGRFFVDAAGRRKTFYAVTNERLILIAGLFSRFVKSMPLRSIPDISLSENRDGSGSLSFGPSFFPLMNQMPAGIGPGRAFGPPAFDSIDHARDVYNIIIEAQKAAANSQPR